MKYKLQDLIDMGHFQNLQDRLNEIYSFPSAIIDNEGNVLTATAWHEYLRPVLDIPYCHHEKWDGSGYPRQLAGEQIPLAARLFAIVDVWDALTSNRPYRQAWPKEKALAYIIDQSGRHFDPQAVDVFLRNIAKG